MGPLKGIKIFEFAGIGQGPFAAMLLSDMGADVIRIDRKGGHSRQNGDHLSAVRPVMDPPLKKPRRKTALGLIAQAHAVIEGFRPGVMERLGLGPDVCLKRNPKLVYGRMTAQGARRDRPPRRRPRHQLHRAHRRAARDRQCGRQARSSPQSRRRFRRRRALSRLRRRACGIPGSEKSGKGQVVCCNDVMGAASLMSMFYGMIAGGNWKDERGIEHARSWRAFLRHL